MLRQGWRDGVLPSEPGAWQEVGGETDVRKKNYRKYKTGFKGRWVWLMAVLMGW